MPTMADITVKKADGTTDIVYNAINPSGGDSTNSFWRSAAATAILAAKPWLTLLSKWNTPKTVRRLQGKFIYPYTVLDTTTGVSSIKTNASLEFTWQVPQDMPSIDIGEASAQGANLVASALIKSCVSAGYAPQ